MSLDSTQVATIGSVAAPVATLFGPLGAAAGLGISAATTFASAELAAQEQQQITDRNLAVMQADQQISERQQRRRHQVAQGQMRARIASSGFTTRGTPIEVAADQVAQQEENLQLSRYRARLSQDDLRYRSEFGQRQTRAQGIAGLASGLASAGQTLLTRIDPPSLLETT